MKHFTDGSMGKDRLKMGSRRSRALDTLESVHGIGTIPVRSVCGLEILPGF
jgi:hypothetical protein